MRRALVAPDVRRRHIGSESDGGGAAYKGRAREERAEGVDKRVGGRARCQCTARKGAEAECEWESEMQRRPPSVKGRAWVFEEKCKMRGIQLGEGTRRETRLEGG